MEYEKEHMQFIDKLIDFLVENLGNVNEERCRFAAASILYEGVNVLYQNSPNKENFNGKAKMLFDRTLEIFMDRQANM